MQRYFERKVRAALVQRFIRRDGKRERLARRTCRDELAAIEAASAQSCVTYD